MISEQIGQIMVATRSVLGVVNITTHEIDLLEEQIDKIALLVPYLAPEKAAKADCAISVMYRRIQLVRTMLICVSLEDATDPTEMDFDFSEFEDVASLPDRTTWLGRYSRVVG